MSGDSTHKKIVIAIALLAVCVALLDVYVFFDHMLVDALRSENNALKDQVSKLQNELNETRREIETLKVRVEDQRAELLNLLSSLNNNISIITQKVSSIEEKQNGLATRVLNLEQNEASLTIDLSKINRAVKDILSENQQLNNKITSLEDRIEKIETPTYTYIGSWRSRESFITESFRLTTKTKFRVWWAFLGSSWDSWFSIWLAHPNGTLIACIAGGSGYYDFGMVELQAYEGSYSLIVYIEKGEAAIDLLVHQT